MPSPAEDQRQRRFSPRLQPDIRSLLEDPEWLRKQFLRHGASTIAARLGCSPRTVRQYAQRAGVELPGHGGRVSEEAVRLLEDAQWLADALQRDSAAELARQLRVARSTVIRYRDLHGLGTPKTDYRIASVPKPRPKRPPPSRRGYSEVALDAALRAREQRVLAERTGHGQAAKLRCRGGS